MKKLTNILAVAALSFGFVFVSACSNSVQSENAQKQASENAGSENLNKATHITISKRGYEPKSIAAKKGQPVKLVFFREDGENCGEELVFPAMNIRRKLSVGATETVEFTPSEAGEIKFTCGMDMLRGKVIVSN